MTRFNPGYHSIQVGDVTITALNDGQFQASTDLITGIPAADAERLLHDNFRVVPPRITVSCFLMELPGRRVIIDFGAGGAYGNAMGRAIKRLAAMDVEPDSIDTILLTHGHPDHLGGLLTGEAATFPNAALHADEVELEFWSNPASGGDAGALARKALAAYAERTQRFSGAASVLPGVTAVPLPGHTPGHTGFMITSGSDSLFMWADVVHLPGLQFAEPKACLAFDSDPEGALASRLRAFDMAAADRLLVAGIHLDFPVFGHVARHGSAYAYEPIVWAPTATGLFE